MPRRMTLEEINGLDRDGFVAALGPLFEGSPWIAAETWPAPARATRRRASVEPAATYCISQDVGCWLIHCTTWEQSPQP